LTVGTTILFIIAQNNVNFFAQNVQMTTVHDFV